MLTRDNVVAEQTFQYSYTRYILSRYVKTGNVSTVPAINAELEKIETALTQTLSRVGDSPNQLEADIDLNGNRLLNLPAPQDSNDPVRLVDLSNAALKASTSTSVVERTGRGLFNIAHRGWADCFPQNTMLAMSSALRRGADALECDLQVTSDGRVVVYHDDSLDTLTNGSGTIATNTLAQVQSATIDETAGTVFSETRIPLFTEFLKYAASNDVDIFPEIKKYRTQADIELMVADIAAYGMESRTVLASFSLGDIQAARGYSANVGVGFLGSSTSQATYEAAVDAVAALGGRGMIIWDNVALVTEPSIITYAFSKGVEVAAYTVDNNTRAKELLRLGVNNIITDIPLETR